VRITWATARAKFRAQFLDKATLLTASSKYRQNSEKKRRCTYYRRYTFCAVRPSLAKNFGKNSKYLKITYIETPQSDKFVFVQGYLLESFYIPRKLFAVKKIAAKKTAEKITFY
jgi:hypothetical protein